MTQCPVVKVIDEIYSGGWTEDDANLIKINTANVRTGSADTTHEIVYNEIVCNDASYYIMSRKIAFARFELSAPALPECEHMREKMFAPYTGIKYSAAYILIMDAALPRKYIHDVFIRLINLLGEVEQMIITKVIALTRTHAGNYNNVQINISIPDMLLLPDVDRILVYRPDLVGEIINKIINYVNGFRINTILNDPINISIPHVEQFKSSLDMSAQMPTLAKFDSAAECIAFMKSMLEHECIIAGYVCDIEKYHCAVINHMNKIYDWCNHVINGIKN